jgi:hypothetical protein
VGPALTLTLIGGRPQHRAPALRLLIPVERDPAARRPWYMVSCTTKGVGPSARAPKPKPEPTWRARYKPTSATPLFACACMRAWRGPTDQRPEQSLSNLGTSAQRAPLLSFSSGLPCAGRARVPISEKCLTGGLEFPQMGTSKNTYSAICLFLITICFSSLIIGMSIMPPYRFLKSGFRT